MAPSWPLLEFEIRVNIANFLDLQLLENLKIKNPFEQIQIIMQQTDRADTTFSNNALHQFFLVAAGGIIIFSAQATMP